MSILAAPPPSAPIPASPGRSDPVGLPHSPGSLDLLARRLEHSADLLRGRVVTLMTAAGSARWQSSAAAAFRQRVEAMAADFHRAAGQLDDAAWALREHAAAVRRREQALGDVAHLTAQEGTAIAAQLAARAASLGSMIGGLGSVIGL